MSSCSPSPLSTLHASPGPLNFLSVDLDLGLPSECVVLTSVVVVRVLDVFLVDLGSDRAREVRPELSSRKERSGSRLRVLPGVTGEPKGRRRFSSSS